MYPFITENRNIGNFIYHWELADSDNITFFCYLNKTISCLFKRPCTDSKLFSLIPNQHKYLSIINEFRSEHWIYLSQSVLIPKLYRPTCSALTNNGVDKFHPPMTRTTNHFIRIINQKIEIKINEQNRILKMEKWPNFVTVKNLGYFLIIKTEKSNTSFYLVNFRSR